MTLYQFGLNFGCVKSFLRACVDN